jgi:hypothetical protein
MENTLGWIAAHGYSALCWPLTLGIIGTRFPDDFTLALAGRPASVGHLDLTPMDVRASLEQRMPHNGGCEWSIL